MTDTRTTPPMRLPEVTLLMLLMAGVATVIFAVHWPVLHARAISFDDSQTFLHNPRIQNPSWESVRMFFTEVTGPRYVEGYYRPLTLTTLMLDRANAGSAEDFLPYHRTSLTLHVLCTALLIVLCYQLFGQPLVAAMVGLLFGLHPLTVEPVAWVMERKTVLAACFAFACLCAYVQYANRGRRAWFALSVLFYLLSLLSKPTGTPLPLMMLLIDYWPMRRLTGRAVAEKIPFFVLAVAFAALTYFTEHKVNDLTWPIAQFPLRACWLIMFYLGKVLVPINLSSVYTLPTPLAITNPVVLAGVVGSVALAAALFVSRRWTPAVWVGLVIFVLGLAPTLGLVRYSWVAASDKYVYLPAVGLVLILAWLLNRLWAPGQAPASRRTLTVVLVLAAACSMAVGTRRYISQWETSEKLHQYMLKLAPDSPQAHYEVAGDLRMQALRDAAQPDQTLLDKAIAHYEKAAELSDNFAGPHYGMAWILSIRGKTDEAIQQYELALAKNPKYMKAYVGLAQAYLLKNQLDKAVETTRRAITILPDTPSAYQILAAVLIRQGRPDEAVDTLRKAVAAVPDDLELMVNLGDALNRAGRRDEAVDRYKQTLARKPDYALAHYCLASIFSADGRTEEAISHYGQALRIQPKNIAIMNDLAWVLATHKIAPAPDTPSAVTLAETVCERTQRREPAFLDTLAAAYARAGRYPDAERVAQEAIDLATAIRNYRMVRAIDARLHLYRSGQPYEEKPSTAPADSSPASPAPAIAPPAW